MSTNIDLTVISLNCRGLNDRNKIRSLIAEITKLDKKESLCVLLQETMITDPSYLQLIWKNGVIFSAGTGSGRGCITLIRGFTCEVVTHLDDQRGHHAIIKNNGGDEIDIFNVYAPNGYGIYKQDFLLNVLHASETCDNVIIGGDLNVTLKNEDRLNMQRTTAEANLGDLISETLVQLDLNDLWAPDSTEMTWKGANSLKQSKLDRIIIKGDTLQLKPLRTIWNLTTTDHAAVITESENTPIVNPFLKIITNKRYLNSKKSRKHFHDSIKEMIKTDNGGTNETNHELIKMLIRTKYEDRVREITKFQNIEIKIRREEINLLQTKIELNSANQNDISRHERLTVELHELMTRKGKINADKLKQKWAEEGERSTKYFLNLLKSHNQRAQIKTLRIGNDVITNKQRIAKEIMNFYSNLYELNPPICGETLNHLLAILPSPQVDKISSLNNDLTSKELLQTLRGTADSAPGPDGITYSYLKFTWGTVKTSILESWNNWIKENNSYPNSWKESTLTLLPKAGKDIQEIKNWRPITLSNCDLKLITKTLARRLTETLEEVISAHQTAYMTNRTISDNLRIINFACTQAHNTQNPLYLISLDAKKAFDSISHKTISMTLKYLGLTEFEQIFYKLYDNQTVHVVSGGETMGKYKLHRGVKQGDALSCILFILIMELVLRRINHLELRNFSYKGITLPTAIAYADDVTVMLTNKSDVHKIFAIYEEFRKATGLELNADKTEVMIFNDNTPKLEITYNGIKSTITPQPSIKINGLTFFKKPDETYKYNWDTVKEKLITQLKMWVPRHLTILGKITIIKTFGYSQILYLSRVIPPNAETIKEIKYQVSKFIWNRSMSGQKAPNRIKQRIIEKPQSLGGFGLTPVEDIILRMNYVQIIVNELKGTLGTVLNHQMCNLDSIAPVAAPYADGVIKNFVNTSRECWVKRLTQGLEDDELNYPNEVLLYDVLEDRHRKGIYGFMERKTRRRLRDIDIREILAKIKPEYRLLTAYLNKPLLNNKGSVRSVREITCVPLIKGQSKPQKIKKAVKSVLTNTDCECCFKAGIILDEHAAKKLINKICKIKSIWARTMILRYLHGDQPYNSKFFMSGYSETPNCEFCYSKIEDFEHKHILCPSLTKLNNVINNITAGEADNLNDWITTEKSFKNLTIIAYIIRNLSKIKKREIDPKKLVDNLHSSPYVQ